MFVYVDNVRPSRNSTRLYVGILRTFVFVRDFLSLCVNRRGRDDVIIRTAYGSWSSAYIPVVVRVCFATASVLSLVRYTHRLIRDDPSVIVLSFEQKRTKLLPVRYRSHTRTSKTRAPHARACPRNYSYAVFTKKKYYTSVSYIVQWRLQFGF